LEEAGIELFERDHELVELEKLLRAACAGQGGVAIVAGEAGVGKSALLTRFRHQARGAGARVLHARCVALEQSFAFGVARTLVGRAIAQLPASERDALVAGAPSAAGAALGLTRAPQTELAASPALLDAIYWIVEGLCATQPVALVIDDLQWADGPSLQAVAYVANRTDELPLAIVVGIRNPVPSDDPEALRVLRAAAPAVHLQLDSLGPDGIAALASSRGVTGLPRRAMATLYSATGGNPLFATEILAAVKRSGGAIEELTPVELRTGVLARLAATSAVARAVADAIATLGDDIGLAVVAMFTEVEPEAVLTAADELTAARIFRDAPTLRFSHPLIAEAVASGASVHARSLRHLRAASVLRRAGATDERVASQLLHAPPTNDPDVVATLRAAAADAARRGAPRVATVYLDRALAEPPAEDEVLSVLTEIGLAELAAGDFHRARNRLDRVAGGGVAPAHAVLTLGAASLASPSHEHIANLLLDAAARDAHDPDGALLLRAGAEITSWHAPVAARPVIELPPPGALRGTSAGERMALAALSVRCLLDGSPASRAADFAARALDGGAIVRDSTGGWLFANAPTLVLLYAEQLEAAQDAIGHMEAFARDAMSTAAMASTAISRSYLNLSRGQAGAAAAESLDAIRFSSRETGTLRKRFLNFTIAWGLAAVLAHEGADAADAVLREHGLAGELAPEESQVMPIRTHIHLACGRHAAALQDAKASRAHAAAWGMPIDPIDWHLALPLALLASGDETQAQTVAVHELKRQRQWGAPGRIASALRVVARTNPARALEALDEAMALVDGTPLRLERAHVLVERGAALRRAGARQQAKSVLQEGAQLAVECQARPLAALARGELNVLGARPRRLAFSGVDALTASERRIVELAAAGQTNREIAQRLFVTLKTVEGHLANAYRKLDIGSRRQLPAVLTGH